MKTVAVASLAVALFAGTATARQTTFGWDPDSNWPTGTTVELCSNGVCANGITSNQHTLEIPVYPGDTIDARARAIPPAGYQCGEPLAACNPSSWATLAATIPVDLVGVWVKKSVVAMAAPTFVAQYATAFNNETSPKTAMNAVAINSGDVIVAVAARGSEPNNLAFTENGTAAWTTLQSDNTVDYASVLVLSYVATNGESLTVTVAGSSFFGANAIRFSGSSGIGASNKAQAATGSPSVTLTTTQANSAIVVLCSDWNAVSGTQTFTNNGGAGSPTPLTGFPGNINNYGVAIAYYADAGAVGSKTVGMSAPTGQRWTIVAVEVKGTAGGAATGLPRRAIDGPLYGALRGSVR